MDTYNDVERFNRKVGGTQLQLRSFEQDSELSFNSQWVLLNDIAGLQRPVSSAAQWQSPPVTAPVEDNSDLQSVLKKVSV